jgi:hypothetical protein
VDVLQTLLRQAKLPVSGNKGVLLTRLAKHYHEYAAPSPIGLEESTHTSIRTSTLPPTAAEIMRLKADLRSQAALKPKPARGAKHQHGHDEGPEAEPTLGGAKRKRGAVTLASQEQNEQVLRSFFFDKPVHSL